MKKKCLIALLLAMVLLWSTLCPVYAAGQPDRMIGDGYVQGSISTGSYTVTAYASSSVKSVSVSGTLYESGLFGIWHSVASCTNSSQGNRCVATGTYATKSGKAISWNMRQHLLIQTEPVKRFRAPRQNSTR